MITKDGQPIRDLADWEERAGPKRACQWQPNRSAMECARTWLSVTPPSFPAEIAEAFDSHPDFGRVTHWAAEPEVRLRIDKRRGEPRNTDMLLLANDLSGEFLVALEAKADEHFDVVMRVALVDAVEARLENPRSGAIDRAIDLITTLLGPLAPGDAKVGELRYQLFAAAVGALRECERRKLQRAVLLVHEFVTDETMDHNHEINDRDLCSWLRRISRGQYNSVPHNSIVGPITVPGTPLLSGSTRLYVGKAQRNIRTGISNTGETAKS
jgi:hypothetical protein